tara:strand:+ start:415 stop:633 length:219 start_codon:yes stop_codon:yes gene_type:complete
LPVTAKSPDEETELPNRAVEEPDNVPVMLMEERDPVAASVSAPVTLSVLPSVVAPTTIRAPEPDIEPGTVTV